MTKEKISKLSLCVLILFIITALNIRLEVYTEGETKELLNTNFTGHKYYNIGFNERIECTHAKVELADVYKHYQRVMISHIGENFSFDNICIKIKPKGKLRLAIL